MYGSCDKKTLQISIYLLYFTYLEVSSTPPPPSSEPVWVVERTLLSEPRWSGSSGPEPRRSRQSRHRRFFLPEVKSKYQR